MRKFGWLVVLAVLVIFGALFLRQREAGWIRTAQADGAVNFSGGRVIGAHMVNEFWVVTVRFPDSHKTYTLRGLLEEIMPDRMEEYNRYTFIQGVPPDKIGAPILVGDTVDIKQGVIDKVYRSLVNGDSESDYKKASEMTAEERALAKNSDIMISGSYIGEYLSGTSLGMVISIFENIAADYGEKMDFGVLFDGPKVCLRIDKEGKTVRFDFDHSAKDNLCMFKDCYVDGQKMSVEEGAQIFVALAEEAHKQSNLLNRKRVLGAVPAMMTVDQDEPDSSDRSAF